MTTKKTIVTALLVLITLSIPLSLYSQSQDFEMFGTVLIKYRGNAENVTIPEGVTSIGSVGIISHSGYDAFRGCTSLTSVTIPSSVTSIGENAFRGCTSLTSIIIPSSVTTIGYNAFNGCTNLTSITIPSSVTSIGRYAFHNTAWLNSQPDGFVYAGKVLYTFKGTQPTVINNIRNDTIAIADGAFSVIVEGALSTVARLTSITIPSSVTSIGNEAFYLCSSLTRVTVPRRTRIGSNAFPSRARITYSD